MEVPKKRLVIPVAAAMAGVVFAWMVDSWEGSGFAWELGRWLRRLSESGPAGNGIAWGIVLALSAFPALGLLLRERQRADWLLLLAGAEMMAGLYCLVNPSLVFPEPIGLWQEQISFWAMAVMGCTASTLTAWALLRLLRALEGAAGKLLPGLLQWTAGFYAFLATSAEVRGVLSELVGIRAGNTDPGRVFSSGALLWVLAVLRVVPALMGAWVIQWGADLTWAMEQTPFSAGTLELAGTVARRCAGMVRLSLLTAVACNILQLIWLPSAANLHITVYLPVGTLALCAGMLVLCRYFQRAKAVSDDNDSII